MAPLRALILLVDGLEETEAIGPVDVLRRAEMEVTMAGLHGLDPVTCAQKTRILPDAAFDDVASEKWDLVVVPGGLASSEHFAKEPKVGEVLRSQLAAGGYVGAICAAPLVLASHGIQKGATVTSYPLARARMEKHGYKWSDQRVVVDGKLITSQGPGTSLEFAIKLVEVLKGAELAKKISDYMLI